MTRTPLDFMGPTKLLVWANRIKYGVYWSKAGFIIGSSGTALVIRIRLVSSFS